MIFDLHKKKTTNNKWTILNQIFPGASIKESFYRRSSKGTVLNTVLIQYGGNFSQCRAFVFFNKCFLG